MTERLTALLERYGQEVLLSRDGTATAVRAFFQPVTDRGKAVPYAATSLGAVDDRQWRCLTRAELREGDAVTWRGTVYQVQNAAPVYVGEELSHWWGMLTRQREAVT
jgi:hypothetical protein